ncbi:MAG: hypothetical protein R6V10_15315 [bacterium]
MNRSMKYVAGVVISLLLGLAISAGPGKEQTDKMPSPFTPSPSQKNDSLASKATNLGEKVNSESSDIGPIISPDGNSLFFTSDREGGVGGQDVWVSQRKDGEWQAARNIGPPINTPGNEGPDCFSPSEQALYFTACDREEDTEGECDIYVSFRFDGQWSKPANLGPPVNTEHNEMNASVSPDGDFIIFASDRPGGQGGTDLWMAERGKKLSRLHPGFETEGRWKNPRNLGPEINTPEWEGIGFLMPNKETLYFSSQGHGGFGGADIFRAEFTDGDWKNVENVGEIINTSHDDIYFTLPASGDLAYFSSDMSGGFGQEDIYSIPVPCLIPSSKLVIIRGKVIDAGTGEPVKATIKVSDPATAREVAEVRSSSRTGSYRVAVKLTRLKLMVSEASHQSYTETIEVKQDKPISVLEKEISLSAKKEQ